MVCCLLLVGCCQFSRRLSLLLDVCRLQFGGVLCLMVAVFCSLSVVWCSVFGVCFCLLLIGRCWLSVYAVCCSSRVLIGCWLFVGCCLLVVVRVLSCGVCSLLFVVYCRVLSGVCVVRCVVCRLWLVVRCWF